MQMPELRPYQQEYKIHVKNFLSTEGNRSVLLVMPTGTGKTTVFSSLTLDWLREDKKIIIIVHRIELVDQIVERLETFGINPGVIAGGYPKDFSSYVQVSMIQSLPSDIAWTPDYIVIDECHHSTANSYLKLWENFPGAKTLGVTATPVRLDGKGFATLYDGMINLYNIRWFIDKQFLLKPKHYICSNIVEGLSLSNGDYDLVALSKMMREERRIADVVNSYRTYVPNRKAVVFACDVAHSLQLVHKFRSLNISAEHLDASTEKEERKRIIKDFRSGKIKVLLNYDIISEGFDVADIEAVILARRSKSLSYFIQTVGRCLRPDGSNKIYGYVLDCSSQWLDHGFAGINYNWNLEGKPELIVESITSKKLFFEDHGKIKTIADPEELVGLDLVAVDEEMQRLYMFDKYLTEVEFRSEEAIYLYNDFLLLQGQKISTVEKNYVQHRLKEKGVMVPSNIWDSLAA